MKTIVGVDLAGMYEPALDLCLELEFPRQEFVFVHVVEPIPPYAPPMDPIVYDSYEWMTHLRRAGETAVQKAEALARSRGAAGRHELADGSPGDVLESIAEGEKADLIVAGAVQRSALGQIFFGSVARSLCLGAKRSLLITKNNERVSTPLKALFATDHSAYADRCLQRLVEMAPQGLSAVDVATAFEIDPLVREVLERGSAKLDDDVEKWIVDRLEAQTQGVADALNAAGYLSQARLVRGHPNEAIQRAMRESGASLLIVGAQGHGFLERTFIGSVSLHQVVAERYPVLLLRV